MLPQLARARGEGIELSVGWFLPWKDALAGELSAAGCEVHCFGARSPAAILARVPAVAAWLRERADLVHAHLPLAGVAARLAGQIARLPVVYSEHNLQERYHPWTRRLNAWTWRLQDRVIAVSSEVEASIRRHIRGRVPVRVVLNGIDASRFRGDGPGEARQQLGLSATAPIVGTVAVLRAQKRLDLWLEAARQILDAIPAARFVIVGDGPLRQELEAHATEIGIAAAVTFAGLQEDVVPYVSSFDVFLTSSEFEGLPLALLEALAASRAVVATAVGGVPEVIRDGEGVLVPFGDPEALAAEAIRLLRSPEERLRLGENARRRVVSDFSVSRMARELEALYREVLAERG